MIIHTGFANNFFKNNVLINESGSFIYEIAVEPTEHMYYKRLRYQKEKFKFKLVITAVSYKTILLGHHIYGKNKHY